MGSTGNVSGLDLSIMILCVGRLYNSKAVAGYAVMKYIGNEFVVYDYYDSADIFTMKKGAEYTKTIKDFKETYSATPFLYEPGEV